MPAMPNTDTATADRPRASAAESLPRDAIARIAASLHEAERARVQVRAPSLDHPGITIEDAYAIQSEGIRLKLQEGRRIIGRKIGLTSRAMQRSSQIEEPDYGVLLDGGIALRGLFIIDPKGVVRQITINDLPIGRSVDETLRLIQALEFNEKHGEVCPANWTPGKDTIKPDPEKSKEYFKKAG
ncbi:MAG: hypothetical protein K8I02_12410 [Candidatus Methylomirabilis sp.]|nr:hypothetical protein [Deltaproteobacteria bacterium]